MAGVMAVLMEAYNSALALLPMWAQNFVGLFLLVLLIVIYSVFIWKFYRFVSTKNIINLNLNKYNKYEHPFFSKLVAGILYLVEYIIILPFLIFFWFAIFTFFLILLTQNLEIQTILVISATIIAAIRITSYIPRYGEDLAKEIAKLLPFTLLAVAITTGGLISFEKAITHLQTIPQTFSSILTYLAFIIILEILLRFFDFIFSLFGLEEMPEVVEV